jgi:hypothetical protein
VAMGWRHAGVLVLDSVVTLLSSIVSNSGDIILEVLLAIILGCSYPRIVFISTELPLQHRGWKIFLRFLREDSSLSTEFEALNIHKYLLVAHPITTVDGWYNKITSLSVRLSVCPSVSIDSYVDLSTWEDYLWWI